MLPLDSLKIAGLVLSVFFLLSGVVSAHTEGIAYTEEIDGKLVSIGRSAENIEEGVSVRFDFLLEDFATDKSIEFTDVWVRIYQGRETFFAGGIHKPEFGEAGIVYIFAESGEYTLSARFQNEGESIAEVEMPVKVSQGELKEEPYLTYLLIGGVVGFLAGSLLLLFRRRKMKTQGG